MNDFLMRLLFTASTDTKNQKFTINIYPNNLVCALECNNHEDNGYCFHDSEDSYTYEEDCGNVNLYKNGKLHCDNGPAVKYIDGTLKYYKDGLLHRLDGPAVHTPHIPGKEIHDYNAWYFEGKSHREGDLPAVECEFKKWLINGELHRENAPAVIEANGDESWYYRNLLHRYGGPARITKNASGEIIIEEWFSFGQRNRTDGAAIIDHTTGKEFFYLKGNLYTKESYSTAVKI